MENKIKKEEGRKIIDGFLQYLMYEIWVSYKYAQQDSPLTLVEEAEGIKAHPNEPEMHKVLRGLSNYLRTGDVNNDGKGNEKDKNGVSFPIPTRLYVSEEEIKDNTLSKEDPTTWAK